MFRRMITCIYLMILAGCSGATAPLTDVQIVVVVEPLPAAVGDATLFITVTNADGTPVTNARVQVQGNMDQAGMETIERIVTENTDGVYRVPFLWTMGGGWELTVNAEIPQRGNATTQVPIFVEAVSTNSVIYKTPTP
jgi:hypothetical protein